MKEGVQVVVERESDSVVLKMIVSIEQLLELIHELVVETIVVSPTATDNPRSDNGLEAKTNSLRALMEDRTAELFEFTVELLAGLLDEQTGEACAPALADEYEYAPLTPLPEHAVDELTCEDGDGAEVIETAVGELVSEEAERASTRALCDALAAQLSEIVIESLDE